MAGVSGLKGLSEVLRNLNREVGKIQGNTEKGLTAAALVIKRDSVIGTPIDLGNLRNSCFIMVTGGRPDNPSPSFSGDVAGDMTSDHSRVMAQMGSVVDRNPDRKTAVVAYSAVYALYVHEMPSHYNFNDGHNKFLEASLRKNQKRVLQILGKYARIR